MVRRVCIDVLMRFCTPKPRSQGTLLTGIASAMFASVAKAGKVSLYSCMSVRHVSTNTIGPCACIVYLNCKNWFSRFFGKLASHWLAKLLRQELQGFVAMIMEHTVSQGVVPHIENSGEGRQDIQISLGKSIS